jgi:hypothetical protein
MIFAVTIASAHTADGPAIVELFETICVTSKSALAAAESASEALGWRKDDKLSGQQSAFPSQSIETQTWELSTSTFRGGALSVSSIQDESGPSELCAVSLRQFSDPSLEAALASKLSLGAPTTRRSSGDEVHATWQVDQDVTTIWYLAQRLTDGPGVQLGIAKRQLKAH